MPIEDQPRRKNSREIKIWKQNSVVFWLILGWISSVLKNFLKVNRQKMLEFHQKVMAVEQVVMVVVPVLVVNVVVHWPRLTKTVVVKPPVVIQKPPQHKNDNGLSWHHFACHWSLLFWIQSMLCTINIESIRDKSLSPEVLEHSYQSLNWHMVDLQKMTKFSQLVLGKFLRIFILWPIWERLW